MLKSDNKAIFFGGYLGQYTRLQKIILVSLLIGSIVSFVVSLGDINKYGGLDLRNKVVGARYMLAGMDPYKIEWSPPSEWFLDPPRKYPGPNRTTVTPLVLMVYCPFAWLPYHTQRIIWALIEWLAMIICILVLIKIVPTGMAKFVFLVFSLLFFVSGLFWRLHVEKGQFYIFLTFILSLSIFFDMKGNNKIGAILLGLLSILRPTFIITLPLLILLRRWKMAGFMALACVAIFTLSLIGSNIQMWVSYVKNVFLIQRIVIDKEHYREKFGLGNTVPGNTVPENVEGVNLSKVLPTSEVPISSLEILKEFDKKIHRLSPAIILQLNKVAGISLIILCFCLAFLIGKYSFNKRFMWIFIMAVVLNVDYFTPIRWQYADIMFLPVIALAAPLFISPFVSISFPVIVTSAFLLGYKHIYTLSGFAVDNIVRSLLFIVALNTLIVSCVYKKVKRSCVRSEKVKVDH